MLGSDVGEEGAGSGEAVALVGLEDGGAEGLRPGLPGLQGVELVKVGVLGRHGWLQDGQVGDADDGGGVFASVSDDDALAMVAHAAHGLAGGDLELADAQPLRHVASYVIYVIVPDWVKVVKGEFMRNEVGGQVG